MANSSRSSIHFGRWTGWRASVLLGAALVTAGVAAAPLWAQQNVPQTGQVRTATPPKSKETVYVGTDRVAPWLTLAPPPLPGSREELAELRELHDIQEGRTEAELSAALRDDRDESIFLFSSLFGQRFNPDEFPATAALGEAIRNDASAIEDEAKSYFKRRRPYAVDRSIAGCPHSPSKPVLTSYPSGHAMSGYSYGAVLASLLPERAGAILTRAHAYAENRLVCGLHFRSDIDASATLATAFARDLMMTPGFKELMQAAQAELVEAGF